jgi:uncharacterized protein YecT (DUF1311 family)
MKNAILILISLLVFTGVIEGKEVSNYKEKEIEDFKPLSEFSSVEEFELNYESYIQSCLDNRRTDVAGIRCYIAYELWDRELNIYYKKIGPLLSKDGKGLLKKSQLSWITARDQSIDFIWFVLSKEYPYDPPRTGNSQRLFGASAYDTYTTQIVKQRALMLKDWYESIYRSTYEAEEPL